MSLATDLQLFENNPRKKQELSMRDKADLLYKTLLPNLKSIIRYDQAEKFILDKEHGIDAVLIFNNQQLITLQEKFLSHQYAKYKSLTVEYEQNPQTHEMGDWIKLACQMYFTGYINERGDAFEFYVLVDFARLVIETQKGNAAWRQNANRDGHARASFKYIHFDAIPSSCIIARVS